MRPGRRRFLTGRPTTWYVYLTAPVSRLAAVIDLDEAVVDTPTRIAEIAEAVRAGNGASVYECLGLHPGQQTSKLGGRVRHAHRR